MNLRNTFLAIIGTVALTACNSGGSSRTSESVPVVPEVVPPAATRVCDVDADIRENAFAEQYQSIINGTLSATGLPGISALVYTPDQGMWMGAAGYATVETSDELTTCNVMFSGSVAKMYTAVAALGLVENGLLGLDDLIADYLPDEIADNLPNGRTATVRQLLNHTAGIPDHDDEEELNRYVEENDGHLPSAEQQLAYLYDNEPDFAAGTGVAYSSAHTVVLSLVVDAAAGEHHSNLLSRNIIDRLGLMDTYYKNEEGFRSDLVSGYLGTGDSRIDITEESINYALDSQGDAGIMATAHDYYSFIRTVFDSELLMPETVTAMQDTSWLYNDGDIGLGFGLGLFSIARGGDIVKLGHSGATLGGMSHVYYYPKAGSYIVLLTNTLIIDDSDLLTAWGENLLVGSENDSVLAQIEQLIGIE